MTAIIEDEIVEAMARAMCIASGFSEEAFDRLIKAGGVQPPYIEDARRQYRAYLAMQATMGCSKVASSSYISSDNLLMVTNGKMVSVTEGKPE